MTSFWNLLLVLPVAAAGAFAAPPAASAAAAVAHPLGRNLAYVRVHSLPGDLPASSTRHQGLLVLDLRFVQADEDASRAFAAWLKFQARPAFPVIVLVNAQTSLTLLAPLADSQSPAGVISIAPAAESIRADIVLHLAAEDDRLAYDAFEHGAPLEELIAPRLDKARHDESTVNQERATGAANGADPDSTNDLVSRPNAGARASPVPLDAVLQRAVQLHRALLALGKIR
ncbi:MAG: hypothetical protein EXS39_02855 [Opitutaceae bacterium]|nr:hypothetical protein [Opitutaceae bacterium]